jgi:hypothetical protein
MRYVNSLNLSIPTDTNEAEFRQEFRWPYRVVIRVKSAPAPNMPAAPLPANGPPSAPSLPKTWADVDPRNSASISAAASGLEGQRYLNAGTSVDDDPDQTGEEIAILRGAKRDEAVHKLISWTTFKDYPTHVGISLSRAETG